MRRLLLIAAACLLLCGCVPTHPIPQQSDADRADLTDRYLAAQWQYLGFTPTATRPTVDVERYVSLEEQGDVLRSCVEDAGYELTGNGSASQAEAVYRCNARFPIDPSAFGLFGAAELGFIYDYYLDGLIPCLAARGFSPERLLSREEFLEPTTTLFLWSPYDEVPLDRFDFEYLSSVCPTLPPELRE